MFHYSIFWLSLLLFALPLSAETLFLMDFESDAINPVDSLGGEWTNNSTYVKHSESSGVFPHIFGFGGSQGNVARAISSTGGSGRSEWFRGGLTSVFSSHTQFVLEADILYNSSGNFIQTVQHDGRVFGFGAQIIVTANEEIVIRENQSSSNFTFTGVNLSKGVFHQARFEYDGLDATVFIDGISLGTFTQQALPDLFISGNSPDRAPGDYMIDNVRIFTETIPEPSSLILSSLALVLLFLRKKI